MSNQNAKRVASLIEMAFPNRFAPSIFEALEPMAESAERCDDEVDAVEFTVAMNSLLFADLLERAPTASAYVGDVVAAGGRIRFDHGAIRTILMPRGDTGGLPRGELAFRRILEPLGYVEAAIYPLPALRMTGRAYRHVRYPATIPQFFVSELHVDDFDVAFVAAAERVFGESIDPIDAATAAVLGRFAAGKSVSDVQAAAALRKVVSAFARHHPHPALSDYDILKARSAEAAWIATEGNAFNHATDRVRDVEAVADEQRRLCRPIKDRVECSASGRVRQTAFRADDVQRDFSRPGLPDLSMTVPGSFYEFITREVDPSTGSIDLSFDSANATGIFAMTKAA